MSKARSHRRNSAAPVAAKPREQISLLAWVQQRLARLPRIMRMLLAGVFALSLTTLIFPLVDNIYISYFITPETIMVPSFISAGIGLAMYLWGWFMLVGTSGDTPAEQVRLHPALLVYLSIGVVTFILAIILFIQGISMTDMVAG